MIGEAVKLTAFSALAKLAECGTASGQVIKAALELKATYDRVESIVDAGETIVQIAELIEAGDYEGAKNLAMAKGAEFLLEQLVAKVTQKIADGIPCFVAGTEVQTPMGEVAIEDIEPGDRVLTATASDEAGLTGVDPATWRLYTFELNGSSDRVGILQILRPLGWVERSVTHASSSGVWVNLQIPEWNLDGLARLLSVKPCPEIKAGPGRVVLMKSITAYRGEMAKVTFEGFAGALEGTWGHPVFSMDRGDFVPLGSLAPCERVRTADGWATVESMARWWGEHAVYNLEVEDEHQYLAGDARVVSHNDTAVGASCSGRLTQEGLDHLSTNGHLPRSPFRFGKGRFSGSVREIRDQVDTTVANGVSRPNTRGRPGTIYEQDFGPGCNVGTNGQGVPTSRVRVVLNPDGTVKTAFPYGQ